MARLRASTLVATGIILAACGGGDSTSPGQSGSLGVSVAPATVSVPQGMTGTATVTVTRGGGFSGNVTLAMEGAPTGVTIAFSPQPVTGTATGSTMTISVASTATLGRYLMTVRATAPKVDDNSTQIWLEVIEPPDYALGTARDTLSVIQGATRAAGRERQPPARLCGQRHAEPR